MKRKSGLQIPPEERRRFNQLEANFRALAQVFGYSIRILSDQRPRVLVKDAVERMISMENLEQKGDRKRAWIKLLRTHVQNKFAQTFRCYVDEVESSKLDSWLARLDLAETTKKDIRNGVAHFFKWCRAHEVIPAESIHAVFGGNVDFQGFTIQVDNRSEK